MMGLERYMRYAYCSRAFLCKMLCAVYTESDMLSAVLLNSLNGCQLYSVQ